jgi:hypothetical protein
LCNNIRSFKDVEDALDFVVSIEKNQNIKNKPFAIRKTKKNTVKAPVKRITPKVPKASKVPKIPKEKEILPPQRHH